MIVASPWGSHEPPNGAGHPGESTAQTALPCETNDFPALLEMFSYFMLFGEEKGGGEGM